MKQNEIAEALFRAVRAETLLSDALIDAGLSDWSSMSVDEYDASIELHGVADAARLSPEAQQLLFDAGFYKIYVNHTNGWETHYTQGAMSGSDGRRVRYGHRQKPPQEGILVEYGGEIRNYYDVFGERK